jgi:hypothetical protein
MGRGGRIDDNDTLLSGRPPLIRTGALQEAKLPGTRPSLQAACRFEASQLFNYKLPIPLHRCSRTRHRCRLRCITTTLHTTQTRLRRNMQTLASKQQRLGAMTGELHAMRMPGAGVGLPGGRSGRGPPWTNHIRPPPPAGAASGQRIVRVQALSGDKLKRPELKRPEAPKKLFDESAAAPTAAAGEPAAAAAPTPSPVSG